MEDYMERISELNRLRRGEQMILTKSLPASMRDLLKTLSSSLSKPCRSGKEACFVFMNQLSSSSMTKNLWHLATTLIVLSLLVSANLTHAAGRVFYDGFEDGTTNAWQQDDFRNKCVVVTSALDGGP